MITISWDQLSEHTEKGDLIEWLNDERQRDKIRQFEEDMKGIGKKVSRVRLIDADAFEVVGTVIPSDIDVKSYVEGMEYILNKIDSMPTIGERKKGEWTRHYCEDGNPDGWRCDQCAEWYYFGETKPNFCPNCGADMRGGQDGQIHH